MEVRGSPWSAGWRSEGGRKHRNVKCGISHNGDQWGLTPQDGYGIDNNVPRIHHAVYVVRMAALACLYRVSGRFLHATTLIYLLTLGTFHSHNLA